MFVDPQMIAQNIREAYAVFAGMGFEQDITVQEYNLNTGSKISSDYTMLGLQLNKDTIKVGREYQFLTEARPSIYILDENLPSNMLPNHSWRIGYQGKQYSVFTINRIFNLYIIRLKP